MPFADQYANPDSRRGPLDRLSVVEPSGTASADAAEPEAERVPLRLAVYIALVVAAGAAAVIAGIPTLSAHDLAGLIALGVLSFVLERLETNVYDDWRFSMSDAPLFAIAMLYGPGAAAIAFPVVSVLADVMRHRLPWYRNLFNLGFLAVSASVAGWVYTGLLDEPREGGGFLIPVTLVAAVGAYATNAALLSFRVTLAKGWSPWKVFKEDLMWTFPHYIVLGFLGLALGVGYVALGFFGLLVFLAPPLMMQFAIRQYVANTERTVGELREKNAELESANQSILRMSQRLQETYEGTLEALVSALDARDRETKGHSLRVMQYTMDIARALGIPEGSQEWNDIQRGALLHDVGKIGVADSILHKPGPLTPEEWVEMKKHPRIGFEMLQDIPFLAGAARIIEAHHERFDGKGYPKGLAGDEIPLGARIFVIADTFDAMTSDRPYRRALPPEVARDEIVKNSGTQFDPVVVQAFLSVYPRWATMKRADKADEEKAERRVA
ncbi:MAG TPA: HD domain-containing phosphohydrolase [Dehalococcoidia bacterium]|nr:HD domain-containing phosphohydrolase [Dehalococcoidia bacterium]